MVPGGDTKRCSRCGELKPVAAFTRHARAKDGRQPFCNPCQRKAVKSHYWRNPAYYRAKALARMRNIGNRDLIRALKDVRCADCGERYEPATMTFDHVRGQKLFDVGSGLNKPRDVLLAEIAKCEVVCVNCHAERSERRSRRQALP